MATHPSRFTQDALQKKVLKYQLMLSVGCGNGDCDNPNCASNPEFTTLSKKASFIKALELVQEDAPNCMDLKKEKKSNGVHDKQDPTGLISLMAVGDLDLIVKRMRLVFINAASICNYFRSPKFAPAARALFDAIADDSTISEKLITCFAPAVERILIEFSSDAKDIAILASYILLQSKFFLEPVSHQILRQLLSGLSVVDAPDHEQLVNWYADTDADTIAHAVSIIQTYISVRWMTDPNAAGDVAPAVKLLGVLYDANETLEQPLVYTEFYNEFVNTEVDLRNEYMKRYQPSGPFCFSRYPYILDAASKSTLLQLDAMMQMRDHYDEAVMRFIFQQMSGTSPYLVLQVHRETIIADTLIQLQGKNSDDFKKPLKVKFIGEDGVDEGGIQKEFFQLLMRQLFNPEYGMFVVDEESEYFWFNKDSLESELEFELIGIMLGLAIYNSVILDIRFPIAVYKKLLGHPLKFRDLKVFSPLLHKGLVQLLEFDGDVESVFARMFSIEYNFFGETKMVELCPGGNGIALTSANRQEYVELFVDYTFNKSIMSQFKAFQNGFELVCGGPWLRIFRAEELDLSICGSPVLDFHALEAAARYENYTRESSVIVNFWKVVHEMTDEQKRKFLQFCTGSDRVPINGLGSLKVPFVIARNGPDSDRLPTSHTCFNHLLLPDYVSLEKLQERLLTAIQNSEGFGLM